tara:strand:+ start:808 stop:1380 length:573 start_codon:yes stop_codon:yes gene_type:complete
MLIISQNLSNYNIPIPDDAVFRINLAWVNSTNELEILLKKHAKHDIFLDLPINRTKPPGNNYSLSDIIPIINNHGNVKFFAISNVESADDVMKYKESLDSRVNIIPKIESPKGVENIQQICEILNLDKKIIMLDHDDLYSALRSQNIPKEQFTEYIDRLTKFCKENDVILLRTIGVIFSDSEKRISQYVG